ncbi:RNA polymerase sigma-70 factor, ECF subfamily [Cyclobacterium lianum]|uniref:RNA polymerase sigma-70 factor, ECF subfamily n=1 Tax=Cyclobacterium lianum TaxID=388280 RepID=A0A1M7QP24_9BACT|nr:RNA polymerase sigma factor [Cyclobacterium lianum]SHN33148.1 RNA polymerase sigma-70 factor, ECF subfamily [Cyclobacterium lianum]
MHLHESPKLKKLIDQCCRGQTKAQYALFKQTYSYAMGICARFSSGPEEAKEILNDGFLKVFTQIKRYSPDLSFAGWIRRIMINTAIDHYRKNKKYTESHTGIEQVPDRPDMNHTLAQMHSEDILQLVQDLPPAYRMVFTLHVVEEFSHKEIAGILGISMGTSKSNLSKARLRLQQALNKISTSTEQVYGKE